MDPRDMFGGFLTVRWFPQDPLAVDTYALLENETVAVYIHHYA